MTGDPEMYGGVPFVESPASIRDRQDRDLAARLSALEARERHRVHAMRLLHRWMCGPELRPDDRAELTVALAKADPDYPTDGAA